jgi:chorismate-pyruvate lyase
MTARRLLLTFAALIAACPAAAQNAGAWPDTYAGRLEALALIQTLNATLLGSRSATSTLERWCAEHQMAAEPTVKARLVRGTEKPITPEQRERLRVSAEELVRYRRVELACGDHVLSEADNWYVPSRLTPEMNKLLNETDTPFGRAVQALRPFRQTFAVEIHWSPLPAGWERQPTPDLCTTAPGSALAFPHKLFEHRAVLYTSDQVPFSEVDETYTEQVLAFPRPR